jgi:hypothetical protein
MSVQYCRDFRSTTSDDIASATRGLEMRRMTDFELRMLMEEHSEIDIFASKVIVEAAERELDCRWVRRA